MNIRFHYDGASAVAGFIAGLAYVNLATGQTLRAALLIGIAVVCLFLGSWEWWSWSWRKRP